MAWLLLYILDKYQNTSFQPVNSKGGKMRKLIILLFIIGFVGSASAAEVTYHFTAQIYAYSDGSEIFSKLKYSADMPLKGTITIDPEAEPILDNLDDPYASGAYGQWGTGVIIFENQGYPWLDASTRNLLTFNLPSGHHRIQMWTKQFKLDANPDISEVFQEVFEVMQMITLTNDGLDASMPNDLNLGDSPTYTVQIKRRVPPAEGQTTGIQLTSLFKAKITSIMKVEAAASAEDLEAGACSCDGGWKNHGEYVKCVTQTAKYFAADGRIDQNKKDIIVSEAAKSDCGKKK
jgi:hypothetical protein